MLKSIRFPGAKTARNGLFLAATILLRPRTRRRVRFVSERAAALLFRALQRLREGFLRFSRPERRRIPVSTVSPVGEGQAFPSSRLQTRFFSRADGNAASRTPALWPHQPRGCRTRHGSAWHAGGRQSGCALPFFEALRKLERRSRAFCACGNRRDHFAGRVDLRGERVSDAPSSQRARAAGVLPSPGSSWPFPAPRSSRRAGARAAGWPSAWPAGIPRFPRR